MMPKNKIPEEYQDESPGPVKLPSFRESFPYLNAILYLAFLALIIFVLCQVIPELGKYISRSLLRELRPLFRGNTGLAVSLAFIAGIIWLMKELVRRK